MFKKLFFILFVFILFLFSKTAYAGVVINEVMYDLDGGDIDYFEVFNNGDSNIDLTEYKFIVNNDSVNGHGIVLNSGIQNLGAGDFGIVVASSAISNYVNKWGDSGNIFTASFSLPNSISTKIILNNKSLTQVDKLEYDPLQNGANGDDNSLQLINGSWISATPTPGVANYSSPDIAENIASDSNIANTSSVPTTTTPKIKNQIEIAAKNLAFTSVPVEFSVNTTGYTKEALFYGKYFWNFGDGDSQEVKAIEMGKFMHIYFYPGEYTVSLEYYGNYYSDIPDIVDKFNIKVIKPEIVISNVGNIEDFFIEITNNTNYEADISKWVLSSDRLNFVLPKNTILGSKKKITISPKISNFNFEDKNSLKLLTPQMEVVYDYSFFNKPVSLVKNTNIPSVVNSVFQPPELQLEPENKVTGEDLSSSVINSRDNNHIPTFIFVLFIGTTSGAVYFIRRRKIPIRAGDDFELLDE